MNTLMFNKIILIFILVFTFLIKSELLAEDRKGLELKTLGDGACWYENNEFIKIASFNDHSSYSKERWQVHDEIEVLMLKVLNQLDVQKIKKINIGLHCGGYGASLVAKIVAENENFCLWAGFKEGQLVLRSLGGDFFLDKKNANDLCDGYKWGEFLITVLDEQFLSDLEGPYWASKIKKVVFITHKTYKIILTDDYIFKPEEVMEELKRYFLGKNFIRYIEFNEYRHPVGEFINLN